MSKLEETKRRRIALGLWLRKKREEKGLSQNDLAKLLGLDYYTMISQVETGKKRTPSRIPEGREYDWALAIGVSAQEMGEMLLEAYEPGIYYCLKGVTPRK